MRVTRFSIGFGPALFRYRSDKHETVYQVALIPFLAYVQIAGMNPFEESDPEDKGSYANASLTARISAIFAGPLANYLFASVLFFAAFMIGGKHILTTKIELMDGGAAKAAQMKDKDEIVAIDGVPVKTWDELRDRIFKNPNKPLAVEVLREGKPLVVTVTPEPKAEGGGGQIGVRPVSIVVPVSAREAAVDAVVYPAKVVKILVVSLARIITLKDKPQLAGPVGIVKQTKLAAEVSWAAYLEFLAMLSAYLGGFNLVPFPALDGGRLMFLGYEAVTRRRPDARVEAHVHAVGLLMLLALIAVVSVFDVRALR
jgi:regulator of sigma E protease